MSEPKDYVGKDVFGNDVYMGEVDRIDAHPAERSKLLRLIERTCGVSGIFATDESSLSDFCPESEELALISQELGFTVNECDLLCDIAAKMVKS